MFAPLILPFQITLAVAVLVLFAVQFYVRRKYALGIALAAVFLLFIPSCTGIMFAVDVYRYSRFDYATARAFRSDGWIKFPPGATDIVLYRRPNGYRAKFAITTDVLQAWTDKMRALRPKRNRSISNTEFTVPEPPRWGNDDELQAAYEKQFSQRLAGTGWKYDPAMAKERKGCQEPFLSRFCLRSILRTLLQKRGADLICE